MKPRLRMIEALTVGGRKVQGSEEVSSITARVGGASEHGWAYPKAQGT